MSVTPSPKWSGERLDADRLTSKALFREERIGEPLDDYLGFYEAAFGTFADIMEATEDLRKIRECAREVLMVKDQQDLCRYITSPPLSEDDLRTLADCSLAPTRLRDNQDFVDSIVEILLLGLDRERSPWFGENRDATEAERLTAITSTCAMFAMRKMETHRRKKGKSLETLVKDYLKGLGFTEVAATEINNVSKGPQAGQFCGETMISVTMPDRSTYSGKADVVVRLHDGRLMPIECKVSNSETNSYKRLIHDCGEKCEAWLRGLGPANCVTVAFLSGCYSLGNLKKAQTMGLTLFWAHDLAPLGEFIEATRP